MEESTKTNMHNVDSSSEKAISLVSSYIKYVKYIIATVQHKILEGENFSKTVHTKNWWIIFWRMPKLIKVPKIIK